MFLNGEGDTPLCVRYFRVEKRRKSGLKAEEELDADLILIEVAGIIKLVHGHLIGLPCPDLYLWLIPVGHIDEEEEVTLVTIGRGVVFLAYLDGKELKHRICQSKLFMEKRADREIQEYIDTGSPFDKAGAYGIQDKDFINAKIMDGSYENIRGLPIDELEEDLVDLGILK